MQHYSIFIHLVKGPQVKLMDSRLLVSNVMGGLSAKQRTTLPCVDWGRQMYRKMILYGGTNFRRPHPLEHTFLLEYNLLCAAGNLVCKVAKSN